jgi:hypothetical protein
MQKGFAQLFSTYCLAFVNFWQKNISAKSAYKMLVKLTKGIPPLPSSFNFLNKGPFM